MTPEEAFSQVDEEKQKVFYESVRETIVSMEPLFSLLVVIVLYHHSTLFLDIAVTSRFALSFVLLVGGKI